MENQKMGSEGEEGSGERGLLHAWKGYSCSVTPERVLLSRPVLQAALGTRHGVLLAEEPILETALSGQRVVFVAAGSFHSGAVTEDGSVHMWGENASGQCGLSGRTLVPSPTPVGVVDLETSPPQPVRILELACGEQHTLALSARREVWAWGSGCQLGLVTSAFPVRQPQKVEHLAGRYVLQVACGAFHSLALVRCLAPQEVRRPPQDKCGQCNQLLYTMTDKEDHVIISDNHYCPLGVELADGEAAKQGPGSPAPSRLRTSPSEPALSSTALPTVAMEEPHTPEKAPGGQANSKGEERPELNGDSPKTDLDSAPSADCCKTPVTVATGAAPKNSPYPDEQAVKDYLKRLSDHSLAEQAAKGPVTVQCVQPLGESVEPDLETPDAAPLPVTTVSSTLNSLVVSCASAVGERVASTYEALSLKKVMGYYYPTAGGCVPGPGPSEGPKETREDRVRLEESMQGKKSSSLGDIREEEAEGLSRRLSWRPAGHVSPRLLRKASRPRVRAVALTPTPISEAEDHLPSLHTEVFSWGSNSSGQLGHMDAPSTVPRLAKMSEGIRVWDIAAGQQHTLILADGDCFQPILYYSGRQVREGASGSPQAEMGGYTQQPVLLPFCMNLGYVSSVFAGGQSCLALADRNVMGFIASLHELAAAERKFYCKLSNVKSQILRPLLGLENLCAILGPAVNVLLQTLAGHFSRLCHLTGQHSVSLTAFLRRGRDIKGLVLQLCGELPGDGWVSGPGEALTSPELIQRLAESSEENVPLSDLLVTLFYLPVRHLHEYGRLLLKLATCFEVVRTEVDAVAPHRNTCALNYEALALLLKRRRKEAEYTFHFWKSFPGKMTDSLRKPSRRLVCESSNKALTLQNAGRFSVNWFILFNDALVHAQGVAPYKNFVSIQ
ncbi:hypothetical protein JZ751_027737 [Albula glossodonta]|uniref:Alsin n=1 Tax=Albula glossodonta TaxID=121402 RepID=A0A8T2P9J2_9TELE|nr:hypothetical protein JZ751_027737 [Albula glossodonta]